MQNFWTPDRVTVLVDLWKDGHSASQIARQIGNTTRNAVRGKILRLGLSGRTTTYRQKTTSQAIKQSVRGRPAWSKPSTTDQRQAAAVRFVATVNPFQKQKHHTLVKLLDLDESYCRFPIGENHELGYCGQEHVPGSPYCEHHHRICYVPVASGVRAVQPALEDPLTTTTKEREHA
jgi:GcrA cell cycle regulator